MISAPDRLCTPGGWHSAAAPSSTPGIPRTTPGEPSRPHRRRTSGTKRLGGFVRRKWSGCRWQLVERVHEDTSRFLAARRALVLRGQDDHQIGLLRREVSLPEGSDILLIVLAWDRAAQAAVPDVVSIASFAVGDTPAGVAL